MAAPMTLLSQVLLLLKLSFLATVRADDLYEGQRTFTLEHNLNGGVEDIFTKRGTIVVKSIKGGRAHVSEALSLTVEEKKQLKRLVRNNEIYRLRLAVRSTGNPEEDYIMTYAPACAIAESNLSDHLWIHFDHSGEVMSFSVTTDPAQCFGRKVDDAFLNHWNTTVEISQTVQGPTPDTQSYIEKLKKEEQEKAKGQQGENKSFFAKYWMYIVPFMLIMMLASNADPQAGGGGGGGGR